MELLKLTLLLREPTIVRAVPPTDSEAYSLPANHIIPPVTLACIVALKTIKPSAPGKDLKKSSARAVDVVAKVLRRKAIYAEYLATALPEICILDRCHGEVASTRLLDVYVSTFGQFNLVFEAWGCNLHRLLDGPKA